MKLSIRFLFVYIYNIKTQLVDILLFLQACKSEQNLEYSQSIDWRAYADRDLNVQRSKKGR